MRHALGAFVVVGTLVGVSFVAISAQDAAISPRAKELHDRAIVMRVPPQPLPETGSTLRIAIKPERVHLFDAKTERRIETNA